MSFSRHHAYKESGIAWLGEAPAHWTPKRLRFVARLNPSKSEVSALPPTTDVSFLPMEAIGEDGTIDLARTRPLSEVETGYTYFRDGDVTLAKITPCFENGKGAIMHNLVGGFGFGTTELIVARPDLSQTTSAYLNWLFRSTPFRAIGESWMYGAGGQKRVTDDYVRDFAIAFPPLGEQVAIAAFLNRETAKIDALVEEQRRLIELLKEKRQAVISHAVTKGLDPTAPMKDSGVEWLGEVPAHWGVLPLKRDVEYLTSGSRGWADYYSDEGPAFIRIGNLTRDWIDLDLSDLQRVSIPPGAEGARTRVRPGDVLFSITAYLGSVAVVPASFEEAYVSQHVALSRLRGEILTPHWVALTTASWVGQTYFATQGYGGTKVQLSLDDVANLVVTVPPKREQAAIVALLTTEVGKFDALVDAADGAIKFFHERRAALISAAVTGKIDVRESVAATRPIADRTRLRLIVGATIIEAIAGRPNAGRTKQHKIAYLLETHAGVGELEGDYLREAAGPLDRGMIDEMEGALAKASHVAVEQPLGRGGQVTYRILGKRGAFHGEFSAVLGDRQPAAEHLIELLKDLDTRSVEAIATLYAVWNDALIDGESPTNDTVVSGFLSDWHPEKKQKFKSQELHEWLRWMRTRDLVPRGQGPQTRTGRLFA